MSEEASTVQAEEARSSADLLDLVEACADYLATKVALEERRQVAVRLARRATQDWRLTDDQALRAAGARALQVLAQAKG